MPYPVPNLLQRETWNQGLALAFYLHLKSTTKYVVRHLAVRTTCQPVYMDIISITTITRPWLAELHILIKICLRS